MQSSGSIAKQHQQASEQPAIAPATEALERAILGAYSVPGVMNVPTIDRPPRNQADAPPAGGSTMEDVDRDTDHFYMYIYKVAPCVKNYTHDWSTCPFAHKGEKATRRDPEKFSYMASNCPDHKDGNCAYGDACLYSHGVFESCLHPERYKTQMCNMGAKCNRSVCFFAHSAKELRSPYCSPCQGQGQINSTNASTISAILGHSSSPTSPMKQQQKQPPVQHNVPNPVQNAMHSMQESRTPGYAHNSIGNGSDILNQAASLLYALQMMGGSSGVGPAAGPGAGAGHADMQNALELLRNASKTLSPAMGNASMFGGLQQTHPWPQNSGYNTTNGLHQGVDWSGMQSNTPNMGYMSLHKSKSAPVAPRPDIGCSMGLTDMTAHHQCDTDGLPFYSLPQQPFSYLAS